MNYMCFHKELRTELLTGDLHKVSKDFKLYYTYHIEKSNFNSSCI